MKRNIITIAMKRIFIIFSILMSVFELSSAQTNSSDFTIVERTAVEKAQLQKEHTGDLKVFFNESDKPAPYLIAGIINREAKINDLHIYLATRPGKLIFGSNIISSTNIQEFKESFSQWGKLVKGKVIIHSIDVFTTPAGEALKSKLEESTGLVFVSQATSSN